MINYQSKSLGLKDSSLTKTEANTQNSLNNTNDFDYRLKDRHVVDIYIYVGFQAKTRFRAFFSEMEISQLVHDLCEAHQVVQYRVRFPFHVRDMGLGFTLLNIND